MQTPFPKPETLWGDYNIESWSRKDRNLFTLHLSGVSSAIIYADQPIIDRVIKQVHEIINQAKKNIISPQAAIEAVHKYNLFTKEELVSIENNCKTGGNIMSKFFSKDTKPSN